MEALSAWRSFGVSGRDPAREHFTFSRNHYYGRSLAIELRYTRHRDIRSSAKDLMSRSLVCLPVVSIPLPQFATTVRNASVIKHLSKVKSRTWSNAQCKSGLCATRATACLVSRVSTRERYKAVARTLAVLPVLSTTTGAVPSYARV